MMISFSSSVTRIIVVCSLALRPDPGRLPPWVGFLGIDEDDVRGIFHSLADRGLIYSMVHESYVSGNVMINYWERMRMPHEKELIKTRIIEISDFMDNFHQIPNTITVFKTTQTTITNILA